MFTWTNICSFMKNFHKGIINSISLMENENIMNVKKSVVKKIEGLKFNIVYESCFVKEKKKNLNGIIFQWNALANFHPDENFFRWSIIELFKFWDF